jgi:hypothetical protein
MMHRSTYLRITLLCLLIVFGVSLSGAYAQPRAQEQQHAVYLPLVASGAASTQPTPTQPTPQAGFLASRDYLTYNAATAIDPQGGMHLAFYTSDERHQNQPLGQPAFYTFCSQGPAACADGSKWSDLVQIDSAVNEVQIVVTSTGQPRLLIRRNGNTGYDYDYWICDAQCTDAQRWSGLRVTQAAGVELYSADMPQHSFALDSQGYPRFIYSNGWGNGRPTAVYYAFCDAADCTEPGSWQETPIYGPIEGKTITSDYAALVFDGVKPRVVTRINYSGLPVHVDYLACDQQCDDPYSWSATTLGHPAGQQWASWDLALDAAGHPRVALYEPAAPDITVGGKLYYSWCDNDCASQDTPFQIVQVASGEGKNVDLAIDPHGRTHMVYDAGQRGTIGELWCDTSCTSASQWQRHILETSEQLMQQFAPASPLSCDQQERAWLDAIPQLAFDAQGRLVVAYDVKNVARCYTIDPANPTHRIYSTVERIWWAVRLAQFPQP